jgi:hypothetical protein
MQKRSRNLLYYQCESREEYGPRGIGEDLSPIHVLQWKFYSRQVNLSGDNRAVSAMPSFIGSQATAHERMGTVPHEQRGFAEVEMPSDSRYRVRSGRSHLR